MNHTLSEIKRFLPAAAAVVLALLSPLAAKAQELNCNVTFNTDQINGTNKQVFETLQQAVNDYMNTNRRFGQRATEKEFSR